MSAAQSVGPFRLGERVGTSVWKAVDTRNDRAVALKILTKQLPKDTARRDAFVREVRVAAALYHSCIVPIVEVTPIGDNLVMVMESVDGQSISRHVNGNPVARRDFFRLAWQLVDAVRFLHTKGLVHGNINTDAVLVSPNGHLRLAGLNLTNMLPRREGASGAYQQKGADARSVAYMAPEQISGGTTDSRTDVFSLGVVMYEMATGKLPYNAATAPDFARAIVEGQPLSPKSTYPAIDNDILIVLGRCLFKDQFRRHKDARAIAEDISKVEPDAVRVVTELSSRPAQPVTPPSDPAARQSILLMADVANYEALAAADSASAARASARMQQMLGEAVFLFDGTIADPFARRLVAEMPNVENALEAARKGEFDFSEEQQTGPRIDVRLLLHAGSVKTEGSVLAGEAITRGVAALEQLPPLELHLTEEFMRVARGIVRVRDAGARGGMKLYTIPPAETPSRPTSASAPTPLPGTFNPSSHATTVLMDESGDPLPPLPRKSPMIPVAAGLALMIAIAVAVGLFLKRSDAEPVTVAAPAAVSAPVAVSETKIAIAPVTIEGPDVDGSLVTRGRAVDRAVTAILASARGFQVAAVRDAGAVHIAPVMRAGANGPEILPGAAEVAAAVPAVDAGSGIRAVLEWVTQRTKKPVQHVSAAPEVLSAFAEALTFQAANDVAKTEAAVRTAAADPDFLAGQMLAMRFFAAQGKNDEAVAAGQRVVALDPTNVAINRDLARLALASGSVQPAFAAYERVLKENASDLEALSQVARYSAAINDSARFTRTMVRLNALSQEFVPVHAPDLLMVSGQVDAAVDQYYVIEEKVPGNAALALKIGRIAVLRRSTPIAELELKKLEQSDPAYGYHLLKAYLAASSGKRQEAVSELEIAAVASTPGDDFWTSAAEVHAIMGGTTEVLDALEKAANRREPTATYILRNPLFAYLRSDARYAGLRSALNAHQSEIRTALAQISL